MQRPRRLHSCKVWPFTAQLTTLYSIYAGCSYIMWQDMHDKGDHVVHFQNFHFKTYLWNHSSHRLKPWQDYCFIILLYFQGYLCPSHIWYGQGEYACWWHSIIAVSGGLLGLLMFSLWSRRPKLPLNQVESLGLLWLLNSTGLKNGKNSLLSVFSYPSYHTWWEFKFGAAGHE